MTPEQEEQVRRALADAAREDRTDHPPMMPPAVVSRLDGVLAELVAGRTGSGTHGTATAPVADELATRRGRRWPQALVAAAAVAVIAAAAGAVVTGGFGAGGGDADSTSASNERVTSRSGGSAAGSGQVPPSAQAGSPALHSRPVLHTASLTRDVRRVADAVRSGSMAALDTTGSVGKTPRNQRRLADACVVPAAPPGADVVDVRLDGRAATLVLDPPSHGAREARVYSCDSGSRPVRTLSVRSR